MKLIFMVNCYEVDKNKPQKSLKKATFPSYLKWYEDPFQSQQKHLLLSVISLKSPSLKEWNLPTMVVVLRDFNLPFQLIKCVTLWHLKAHKKLNIPFPIHSKATNKSSPRLMDNWIIYSTRCCCCCWSPFPSTNSNMIFHPLQFRSLPHPVGLWFPLLQIASRDTSASHWTTSDLHNFYTHNSVIKNA